MNAIDSLTRAIYESRDFASKGSDTKVQDIFVSRYEGLTCAIALIRIGRLDGTLLTYVYAIYDMTHGSIIDSGNPMYHQITALLPPVNNLKREGGNLGFRDRHRLDAVEDDLLEKLLTQKGTWTEPQLSSYKAYLRERGDRESDSIRELYNFFAGHIVLNEKSR